MNLTNRFIKHQDKKLDFEFYVAVVLTKSLKQKL